MSDDEKIYVRFRGRTLGPLTPQKVRDLIQRGQITRMHELSGDGLSWTKAEAFGEFFTVRREQGSSGNGVETAARMETRAESESQTKSSAPIEAPRGSTVNPHTAVEPTVEWYAHVNGENQGPLSFDQLSHWVNSRTIDAKTLVWRSGLDSWQPAAEVVPELFRSQRAFPEASVAQSAQFDLELGEGYHGSADFVVLAREFNRQRGWAFFFALVLVVLSSLAILGGLMIILTAATGSAAGANTVVPMVFAILGIAFAGTVLTAGVLLLQYCGRVSRLSVSPGKNLALSALKSLHLFWTFAGIASLIWLVTWITIFIVFFSMGLIAINQVT